MGSKISLVGLVIMVEETKDQEEQRQPSWIRVEFFEPDNVRFNTNMEGVGAHQLIAVGEHLSLVGKRIIHQELALREQQMMENIQRSQIQTPNQGQILTPGNG